VYPIVAGPCLSFTGAWLPCGYFGDPAHECKCSPLQVQKYRAKISGPLLDRIDLHIEVPAVKFKELADDSAAERSEVIRARVAKARERQMKRFANEKHIFANAHMETRAIRRYCPIGQDSKDLLRLAISKLGLSARAYDRILKVARTIADLEGTDAIGRAHVAEAIQYRSLDRRAWE